MKGKSDGDHVLYKNYIVRSPVLGPPSIDKDNPFRKGVFKPS